MASDAAVSGVPACTMLRRSLSSDAAASLGTALTCATSAAGRSLAGEPNRRVRASATFAGHVADDAHHDSICVPQAALANVLAITMAASVQRLWRQILAACHGEELCRAKGDHPWRGRHRTKGGIGEATQHVPGPVVRSGCQRHGGRNEPA